MRGTLETRADAENRPRARVAISSDALTRALRIPTIHVKHSLASASEALKHSLAFASEGNSQRRVCMAAKKKTAKKSTAKKSTAKKTTAKKGAAAKTARKPAAKKAAKKKTARKAAKKAPAATPAM